MTQPRQEISDETAELLAAAGIVSTPEGRAKARRRLAEARETMPERHAALRAQLGLEDRPLRSA
jgi:hypothetical protein